MKVRNNIWFQPLWVYSSNSMNVFFALRTYDQKITVKLERTQGDSELYWVFPEMVVPNNYWFSYWKWSFWGVLGVPPFLETRLWQLSPTLPLEISGPTNGPLQWMASRKDVECCEAGIFWWQNGPGKIWETTVDGSEIPYQLKLVVYPIFF